MKKQGDFYLRLITIVLAVVIAAYLLFSLIFNSGVSYALETAVYCEVGDGITVSGFVVRDETVLFSTAPIVVSDLKEGDWVGGGQRVATGYTSATVRENREELAALQAQREQLALAVSASDSSNAAVLDREISTLIVRLSEQTAAGNLSAMRVIVAELEPLVLRRCVSTDDAAEINARIAEIDGRISSLTASTGTGATAVTVSASGYYSEQADGLETLLTSQALETMTLAELREIDEARTSAPANAVGRLITGQKWYFATEIPADRAAQLETGDRLTVRFSGMEPLRMRVERVGAAEDTTALLVLSCERQMQGVTALRRQSADIEFDAYEGIRVPKTALYHIDGADGVYVLESARARWKTVTVVYEYGDYFLVEWDSSGTGNLWPKDELILTAEGIENGQVMNE